MSRHRVTWFEAVAAAMAIVGFCVVGAGIGALIGWATGQTKWGFFTGAFAAMFMLIIPMAFPPKER